MTTSAQMREGLARQVGDFFADVLRVFQVPFKGLPIIVWAYFVVAYIALPNNIWGCHFFDPDDYSYLSHTLDWLQGQSWFDNVQHRMNPPEGVPLHFTRFAELPLAALISGFHVLGYTWRGAALLTAFLLPFAYLGLLFWVLCRVSERFVSQNWARLSPFVAIFAAGLMIKFAPGQVDHHGLVVTLTIGALGLVAHTFEKPSELRYPIAAGFLFALATAMALEALPWMVIASAFIGIWAVANADRAARGSVAFGLSLFAAGGVFLLLKQPLSSIQTPDLLSYSIVYVLLMGGIALSLIAAAASSGLKRARLRWLFSGLVAILAGCAFLSRFPQLLAGPYGGMDPRLADLLLKNIDEAAPGFEKLSASNIYLCILRIVALVTAVLKTIRGQGGRKWAWALLSTCLLVASAAMMFYQTRLVVYAQVFSVIPLVALAEGCWNRMGRMPLSRSRFWAEIGVVALIGPLFTIFLPAIHDGRSFNTGVLMFPSRTNDDPCDIEMAAKLLEEPPYAGRNLRILNAINQGAGFIFFTGHSVFSAPYHTNVSGNTLAMDFFSSTDPARAEQIARRAKADIVAFCRYTPKMYLRPQWEAKPVQQPDGKSAGYTKGSLAFDLMRDSPPKWLKELPLPMSSVVLYEVLPEGHEVHDEQEKQGTRE